MKRGTQIVANLDMLVSTECSEQRKLRARYLAVLRAYGQTVPALDAASTSDAFEEAYERADVLRLLFVHARSDLDSHIREHGCAVAKAAAASDG